MWHQFSLISRIKCKSLFNSVLWYALFLSVISFFYIFFKGSSQKDENSIRRIDLNYDEGNILFFDSIEMVVFFSFPSEIDTNKLTIDKSSSPSLKLYICETISKYWRILHEDDRTHLWLFSKIEFNLKSDPVNRLVLLSVCFIYPISWRYSINWDRKGLPGSEIQMYYGLPKKPRSRGISWNSQFF